ncbi:hypothetical protein R3P38DRAFT_3611868 [Favolaschia claudopus]|uniref:Uncharacterized protein n=1 Tax=Favolaschia claudopus TaxID=2862362 RepID=A0AAW0A5F6_9AGAR
MPTFCTGNLAAGRLAPPSNSHRNINITSPPSALLHRGFCCQQANPILQTSSSGFPTSLTSSRLVDDAPRSGAYSFEYLESLPKFRRAASSALFHQGFCCRQAKAALHTQTNEVPPYLMSYSARRGRAARCFEYTELVPASGFSAAFHVPRELFGSSTTRRAAARSFEYIEFFPASGTLRILPPAGKNHPPDFKQRLSHESLELCSSMTTRRAAACSFEYTDFVPASGVSALLRRGLCRRQAKAAPPNSKRHYHELRCSLRPALILEYTEFLPASGLSGFAFQIFAQVEFPTSSGIRVFAVRRVKLAKGTNQSLPAPRLRRFSKANIKIGNSRFRRPPTADFVREVVQFQIRVFEFHELELQHRSV